MLYQWGRKDPFTFATKSSGLNNQYNGLNPIKIYNAQGKEIVQTLNGDTDTNGGIINVTELASSMLETIRKPNTFYATGGSVINQVELTKDIWDYYWTSYSRGTDGTYGNTNWNNEYLNGYTQERIKSVFDPCPYQFRTPTNGTYNTFGLNSGWVNSSYIGGVLYYKTWLNGIGMRERLLNWCGQWASRLTSQVAISGGAYAFELSGTKEVRLNRNGIPFSRGVSVRCIEDAKKAS